MPPHRAPPRIDESFQLFSNGASYEAKADRGSSSCHSVPPQPRGFRRDRKEDPYKPCPQPTRRTASDRALRKSSGPSRSKRSSPLSFRSGSRTSSVQQRAPAPRVACALTRATLAPQVQCRVDGAVVARDCRCALVSRLHSTGSVQRGSPRAAAAAREQMRSRAG